MSNNLCRYYLHGTCNRGDTCLYVHNLSAKPDTICKYYLGGKCIYGKKCRYDHVRPKADQSPKNSKSTPNTGNAQHREVERKSEVNSQTNVNYLDMESNLQLNTLPHDDYDSYDTSHITHPADVPSFSLYNGENVDHESNQLDREIFYSQGGGVDESDAYGGTEDVYATYDADYSAYGGYAEYYAGNNEYASNDAAVYGKLGEDCTTSYSAYDDKCGLYNGVYEDCGTTYVGTYDEDPAAFAMYNGCETTYGASGMEKEVQVEVCEYCGVFVLSTLDQLQRDEHIKECIQEHEKDMEEAFRVATSEELVCSVCMEVVWQKTPSWRRRFGILSACNHVFCLECIRKWRSEDGYDNQVVRACPECRVLSDFVTPSKYWFESDEDKKKLISEYKTALSQKPCVYYKERDGDCPFSDSCFYLHDGTARTRRLRYGSSGVPERSSRNFISDFIGLAEEMRSLFLSDLLYCLDTDIL